MAKKRYKVKKGDSFATFPNPQQVMQMNPGVPSLSTGQTIFLPSSPNPNNVFGPAVANGGYGPPRPAAPQPNFMSGNSFMSGNQVATGNLFGTQAQPQAGMYVGQGVSVPFGQQNAPGAGMMTGANSFQSGNTVNLQGQAVPSSVAQSGTPNSSPATTTLPANYVYTGGNDAASVEQRRLWNIAAGGTGNERVFLQTRAQIRAEKLKHKSFGGNRQSSVVAVPETPAPQGNMINTALSWRVG